jgi:hypothetical protein
MGRGRSQRAENGCERNAGNILEYGDQGIDMRLYEKESYTVTVIGAENVVPPTALKCTT